MAPDANVRNLPYTHPPYGTRTQGAPPYVGPTQESCMPAEALPDGFSWVWAADTVRINLPPFTKTEHHVLEPILSRADATHLAEAIARHDKKRRATGVAPRLARILIAHDPRYAPETLTKFRGKLSIALVEIGHAVSIDEMVTMSGMDDELEPGA